MFEFHRDLGDENDQPSATPVAVLAGHPNLSDAVNKNIIDSVINGGARPSELRGKGYKVTTTSREYTLMRYDGDEANRDTPFWTIQGHPRFCPEATRCNIHGSTWGGSMLKMDFIGRGMNLEVGLTFNGKADVMTTSPVTEVVEIP